MKIGKIANMSYGPCDTIKIQGGGLMERKRVIEETGTIVEPLVGWGVYTHVVSVPDDLYPDTAPMLFAAEILDGVGAVREYVLWGRPQGSDDALDERVLATAGELSDITDAENRAAADGWHSFRIQVLDGIPPKFGANLLA
jgi:hypothetical protein